MDFIVIGLAVSLCLWIMGQSSVYVHIDYAKDVRREQLRLRVLLLNRIQIYQLSRERVSYTLLEQQLERLSHRQGELPRHPRGQRRFMDRLKNIDYVKLFSQRFVCRKLYCRVQLSMAEADQTAIIYGALQCLRRAALHWLSCRVKLADRPEIVIASDFQSEKKELLFQCIVSAKISHIVYMLKNLV